VGGPGTAPRTSHSLRKTALPRRYPAARLPTTAALLLCCWACSEPASPQALLHAQAGDHRWHEGRSHFDETFRPFDPERVEGPRDWGRLEGQLFLAEERGAPDAAFAKAHFLLWRNQPGDVDRAKARLARLPQDERTWNELALAELSAGNPLAALDAASRAVALSPSDLPSLFNRALALERLGFLHGADEAWATYVERDPSSGWGLEAARRLERLRAEAPERRSFEDERRRFVEALRATRSAAELEALLERPATGRLLDALAAAGDRILASEIEVRRGFSPEDWAGSARRSRQVQEQIDAAMSGGPSEAVLRVLERSPAPSVSVQALRIRAFDAFLRRPPQEALALLDEVIARCEVLGCPVERALAFSDRGSLLLQGGDFRRAEAAFRVALEGIPDGFHHRRAELLGKQATVAVELLQHRRAIELGLEAAKALGPTGDRGFLAAVFSNLGGSAAALGLERAALACFLEGRHLAKMAGRLSSELFAMAGAARTLSDLGEADAAFALIDEAISIATSKEQTNALVALLASSARLHVANGRTEDAKRIAMQAAELASVMKQPQRREVALSIAGTAFAADGEFEEARHLFAGAISLNEESLVTIGSPIERALRLAEGAEIRARQARLSAEDGDAAAAWELLGGAPLRPLEEDECFVAFAALDGSLLAWTATSSGTRFDDAALPLAGEPVTVFSDRRCPRSARRITVLESEVTLAGVGNVGARLGSAGAKVVVARRSDAPWPSRRLQGAGLAVHSPRPILTEQILPLLPGAPKEARMVLEAWPGSMELSGTRATPEEVAAVAARFELLHFGVHAEARTDAGASSHLVLAGEGGFLQVVDVLRLPLQERRPVVVLSACRSGGETVEKEKDGAGLPWAFLEAGAEMVIAYQDNLDDRAAVDFAGAFYPLVAEGVDVAEAFERALAAVRAAWPPEIAASFALYI